MSNTYVIQFLFVAVFYKLNKICMNDIMPNININRTSRENMKQEKHPPMP